MSKTFYHCGGDLSAVVRIVYIYMALYGCFIFWLRSRLDEDMYGIDHFIILTTTGYTIRRFADVSRIEWVSFIFSRLHENMKRRAIVRVLYEEIICINVEHSEET